MESKVICLPEDRPPTPAELQAAAGEERGEPAVVLAFVAPGAERTVAALGEAWPDALRFGCEAVTQFGNAALAHGGVAQLFWLARSASRPEVTVVEGSYAGPPGEDDLARAAAAVTRAGAVLLLVDGLRFPIQPFLRRLRSALGEDAPVVAGGLASQAEPIVSEGARVFVGDRVWASACLVVGWPGVEVEVELVRGWSPASPIYTVTRAEGNVLWEIDGEAATAWYRRFFTVAGDLAPLPETAYRFPLIIEGPDRDRVGVYRSMQRFDDPPGAATFWGGFETGDRIRLGMGNDASLVATAASLAAGFPAEAAILYSCVGREVVLGDKADEEVRAIHGALGGVPLSGFFTFGEVGPTPEGALAFYNQVAVLVLLREEGQ